METSEPLEKNLSGLTSSPADSPVRISVYPEDVLVLMAQDQDYGRISLGSYGTFDRGSYSLRTSQVSWITSLCEEFLGTFTRSGMMRNGKCFQLLPLALPIGANEHGSLPTPMARDQKDLSSQGKTYACQRVRHQPSLVTESYLAEVGGPIVEVYEWAMGFERGWTDLESEPLETPSSPKLQSGSVGE